MDDDSSSLSSALSSAPPSDDERMKLAPIFTKARSKPAPKKKAAKKAPEPPASPPRPPRSPSPVHDDTIADNSDIAFLVMFRSRFSAAFPPKLPHYGPQDLERGVEGPTASPQVENLLCALLGLVLNRKKPVESGHHGRALEEAIGSQRAQWPVSWNGQNPLSGSRNFNTMSPSERLTLLRTLVLWSLTTSEAVSQIIKDAYKQSRHEDDLNQPLSVQPWGVDGDKRRYWLIEGQDDTSFRLYRETPKAAEESKWWSMAGTIDEIKAIADRLEQKDTTQAARRLSSKIMSAIPRFEATEEKRKRRDYRQMRRAQFARPELGYSLYEGRTRGKRQRYTYDDEDDFEESDFSVRRSGRHSDRSTPAEARGPVVTASGRQVRAREGGMYGESLLSNQVMNADSLADDDLDGSELSGPTRRASRSAANGTNGIPKKRKHIDTYNEVDEMSDEDDAASSAGWNSADNEEDGGRDDFGDDGTDELGGDSDDSLGDEPSSLIVKLRVPSLQVDKKKELVKLQDNRSSKVTSDSTIAKQEQTEEKHQQDSGTMDWTPTDVKQATSQQTHPVLDSSESLHDSALPSSIGSDVADQKPLMNGYHAKEESTTAVSSIISAEHTATSRTDQPHQTSLSIQG
ncbi:hypothetical protein BDZ85DRAFT_242935 [Elsinoe ampelina]|uniref:WHIM1 domain-containing protein n=1 Tax=Elsinoe ampelina TaxID=302913 RepID=A0A6A6G1Z5_9PEZI|nr:hypothetical protein BDZ85DRAFT_242935 [Elsinoe ampelina]